MEKWIPGVATFGLVCLMVLPAPGIWGILIGVVCTAAIILSAVIWALDRMSSGMLNWYAARRKRRRPPPRGGRAVHAGSGIARKL